MKLNVILRCYKETFKIAPISALLSQLYQLVDFLFPAIMVIVTERLFDAAADSGSDNRIFFYAVILLGCYAVKQLFELISAITTNAGVYERCTMHYKTKLFEKAARLPLICYEDSVMMNIKKRAIDCVQGEKISGLYMSTGYMLTSGLGILSVVAILSSYSLWFIPISIFSVIPYLIIRIARGKEFYRLKYHQAKKLRKLDYLWGLFTNRQTMKEMRVMGTEDYLSSQWMNCRDEVNNELWSHYKKDATSFLFCDFLRIMGYGLSIFFALSLVIRGEISIGLFGACLAAFTSVQHQVKLFLSVLGNMPHEVAFVNDYYEFMELPEERTESTKDLNFKSSVSVQNVDFQYPNTEKNALDNVSFCINNGEKIAILGENGSGKTTLAKVILGFYEPTEGEVQFDGINIKRVHKDSLYDITSAVTQDFVPYELTLRENIAISDLESIKDEGRIKENLIRVGLEALLEEIQLDDQLGKLFNGKELSGGQWQKIAIARALFKKGKFILLDEPTSALDPIVEAEILSSFIQMVEDKTAFIISHRVGLCKHVDKIIVMKDGKIAEIGAHEELLAKKGEYHRLYKSQEKWYRETG